VPGSPDYETVVEGSGILEEYGEQDIEGAIALLEGAGVDTSTPIDVRLLFAANNPRRASEYELIRDAAAQAGFNVIDGNSPTWGQDLDNNSLYDASLFGWQSTTVDVAGGANQYTTGAINNLGHYPAEGAVDGLYEQMKQSTDPEEQLALKIEVESNLVADAFGLPIFQHPSITAYNSTYVDGVSNIALAPTVFWNVWEWTAAA
jgi:peptide/nickel transport system substrate-binding protein